MVTSPPATTRDVPLNKARRLRFSDNVEVTYVAWDDRLAQGATRGIAVCVEERCGSEDSDDDDIGPFMSMAHTIDSKRAWRSVTGNIRSVSMSLAPPIHNSKLWQRRAAMPPSASPEK